MFKWRDFYLMKIYDSKNKYIGVVEDISIDFYKGVVRGFTISPTSIFKKQMYVSVDSIISIDEDVTFNITIPKLSLDEISKIIEKDELIELYVSERKVLFVFDKNIIQTRLIDGSYPDTARLIPLEFGYELDINRADLLNAIDRVSLLLNEQNNIVKLDMSNEQVILSSYQQEIGSVEENLASSFYKGEPLTISFSCKYASDAIKSFSGDKIKILFTGEMKPFIVKDFDSDELLQLVLPVRTY